MNNLLPILLCFTLLSCGTSNNEPTAASITRDSIATRLQNLEGWYNQLEANNDSAVAFGFYLHQQYLELNKKLDAYEPRSTAQQLLDELNDLMFSGGDPAHNPSDMADMGEVGHFFEETKAALDSLNTPYHWDGVKVRYVLGE